ncbi:MAG TPA: CzcE family metal-binding protein [Duganella sp.]|nr:CzcE family metal-binding protein [Duganella sp.]
MLKELRTAIIATAIIAGTGAVHAATAQQAAYGMAAGNAYADRQITITANTTWVNVNNGETVTFNVNGKTFTWHFDTLRTEDRFDLAKIAPAGIDVGIITVYVASNPLYRG